MSVQYTDALSGRVHVKRQRIKSYNIVEGEFVMDGSVNRFKEKQIPAIAWENRRKRIEDEENNK